MVGRVIGGGERERSVVEILEGIASIFVIFARVCCSVLQCSAVCCSVMQCNAVCCSVLQRDAACCSVLQRDLFARVM